MELAAQLTVTANIDVDAVVTDLGVRIAGADLGEVRFDPSGVLDVVARAVPVDLDPVLDAVDRLNGALRVRVAAGFPVGDPAGRAGALTAVLSGAGSLVPEVAVDPVVGIDGLARRIDAVRAALDGGAAATLLGLLPGPGLPAAATGVGGVLDGLVELARVLAGLTATATVTARLVDRTAVLAGRLAAPAARAAAAELARHSADTALVTAVRAADPHDPAAVTELGGRIAGFLDAALDVSDRWATGMGFGEATLLGVDLAGGAVALEAARLAVSGADLAPVVAAVAQARAVLGPVLDGPLPADLPADLAVDAVTAGVGLIGELTAAVRALDPAGVAAPVQAMVDAALAPLDELRRTAEAIAGGAASAVRTIGGIVSEVDLAGVAAAVRAAFAPVVDVLDAVEDAVRGASDTLTRVAADLTGGLTAVADDVAATAATVRAGLDRVRAALAALDLDALAAGLRDTLTAGAARLAAARLDPYFDAAIGVIDTGASVIAAVPFGLLPTDVQQDIVDVSRPIRQLDLGEVENALRAELAGIRDGLRADALAEVEAAHARVVAVLAGLDPAPALRALEEGPLGELRAAVAAVDPVALLAPADAALERLRNLLAGVDLRASVLDPLDAAFAPVPAALAEIRPDELLAGPLAELAALRERLAAMLPAQASAAAVDAAVERVVGVLDRLDPAVLARVLLDAAPVVDRPAGPPGGPFGSLLVTLAQASGLDAAEDAVADVLEWVRGRADAGAVTRERLALVAARLAAVRSDVAALDPAPLAAAAGAQHRALLAAVRAHPAGSPLRAGLEPLLVGSAPAGALGPLIENRARYLAALDVDVALSATLAATGRSDLARAAAELRRAVDPLAAVPARLRALLGALGLVGAEEPASELVTHLLQVAGPTRVLPALTELVTAARDQLVLAVRALAQPVLDAVATLTGAVDALDLTGIVDELTALHTEVTAQVTALGPGALLGGPLAEVQQTLDRVRTFDPLRAVREVLDAATAAATEVLDTVRPTIVFAPVVGLHADLLAAASGLDVAVLLRPVLDGLDAVATQLDAGFDRTGDALARLQAALPDRVQESSVGVSVSVTGGVGG